MHLPLKNVNVLTVHRSLTRKWVFTLKCKTDHGSSTQQLHLLDLPSCGSRAQMNHTGSVFLFLSFFKNQLQFYHYSSSFSQFHNFLLEAEVHSNPDKGITKLWKVYLPFTRRLFHKAGLKALPVWHMCAQRSLATQTTA